MDRPTPAQAHEQRKLERYARRQRELANRAQLEDRLYGDGKRRESLPMPRHQPVKEMS